MGIIPTYQDLENQVSELKRQNEIFHENNLIICDEKYHSLFNNMSEGFARCQMIYENNEAVDFKYLEVNKAFETLTGLKNVVGKRITEILANHKSENQDLFRLYERVTKTGISERIESFVAPLERWFSISVSSSEMSEFLVIFDNITEHKKAEIALKESEARLKKINAGKDKLFSIIAHDLRAPFSGILMLTELLNKKLEESAYSQSEKYVTLINSSAKNTLILLDNLLNWAKSQTDQINFTPQKIILSSFILKILETASSSATIKNISLNYSQLDEIEVYADENMLEIILQNLISNAIKFTKTGGHITVSGKLEQNQVEITVSDNGIGMKKKIIKKLFRFSTNNTSLGTENEKGSGIGLVLCKEFVEKHNGKIWAESKVGKGSDFKFTLPFNKL